MGYHPGFYEKIKKELVLVKTKTAVEAVFFVPLEIGFLTGFILRHFSHLAVGPLSDGGLEFSDKLIHIFQNLTLSFDGVLRCGMEERVFF